MNSFLIASLAIASSSHHPVAVRSADCRHLPPVSTRAALPNDNRTRAGTLRDGVLTVRLVARAAAWHPEGADGCALAVNAFAEEGRPTQVPGPLLRASAGTAVRVSVRNALATPIWVRGLQDRAPGGTLDSTQIAPGASHDFAFVAKTTGPWIYWANRTGSELIPGDADGQLVGAMIIDSATATAGTPREERVLVLTRWRSNGSGDNDGYQLNAFNGLSFPYSERLRYSVGDSVRWHVLNASNAIHEMHLHGFFFHLDARGFSMDSVRTAPQPSVGDMRVTSVIRPGEWFTISWSPDRAGNWLFHCHLLTHLSLDQRLEQMPGSVVQAGHTHDAPTSANGAHHDMAGLVLALDVRPKRGAKSNTIQVPDSARRAIALYADVRPRTFGEKDGYGFVMQEGAVPPARDSIRIPGSLLVLKKGEPVRIAVHNRLRQPISLHWHGVELESYFDGVGGFSGDAARIAPSIAPNDSFIVRFTPPRAGTYMYHVHSERGEELASGLYGPLVVVDPDKSYDPRTERLFMMADGGPGSRRPLFINGSAVPDTMEMVAGTTYRLRFMWISSNNALMTTLRGPSGPVRAQRLAYDGHDQALAPPRPLNFGVGPGHTAEFEFTPSEAGPLWLDLGYNPNTGVTNVPATTVPIRVRAP